MHAATTNTPNKRTNGMVTRFTYERREEERTNRKREKVYAATPNRGKNANKLNIVNLQLIYECNSCVM